MKPKRSGREHLRHKFIQYLGRAVTVRWNNLDHDWHHFRVERVKGNRVALTGMTNDEGMPHLGNYIWCDLSEFKSVKLRD